MDIKVQMYCTGTRAHTSYRTRIVQNFILFLIFLPSSNMNFCSTMAMPKDSTVRFPDGGIRATESGNGMEGAALHICDRYKGQP